MASHTLKVEHMCMPCSFRDLSQEASFWCLVCKEGLCSSCRKHHLSIKALQSHDVLPFEGRESIPEMLEQVQQTCLQHDRNFEFYCSDHQEPCCIRCISQNHKGCQNVCPINEVIENVKSSIAINHIEEGIDGMILKMETIIQKKEEADHTFEGQVNTSKQDVTDLRKFLEKKLDDICKILYAEIDEIRLAYCEEMSGKMDILKERLKNMRALKSSLILAKENGTKLQLFLCLVVFEESLSKQESFLSTSLEKGDFNNKEISFKLFDDIKNALKVEHLGKVEIKTKSLEVFSGSLSQSPRILGKVDIDNVKLVKKKEMKFSNVKVTSCAILPNGSFLFTDFSSNNRLMLYDANCIFLRYIPTECPPFGIAILNQSTLATTLPSAKKVLFLEILSGDKIVKLISLLGECFGIDSSGNRLAIAVKGYGIQIFSIDGSLLKTIQFSCTILSFNGSYIYYIEGEQKELKCCDDNGHCIWHIQLPVSKFYEYPSLSTDEDGNVYIAERHGDQFFMVSHDGKKYRLLLQRTDALYNICGIHMDRQKQQLLVCTKWNELAVLYDFL